MIERRGSGAGLVIGLAVLLVVCIAACFVFAGTSREVAENNAISPAARSVESTADKAGAAIDKNS